MPKNIIMCFIIYLMINYSCINKHPESALVNNFKPEKKAVNCGPQNTTSQCLAKKQKLVKLHNHHINNAESVFNTASDTNSADKKSSLPTSQNFSFPNQLGHTVNIHGYGKGQAINADAVGTECTETPKYGLLRYRKWWERTEVDLSVNGKLVTGTPIFIEEDTLRVINNDCSYFIPLEKVDYIRTNDGLQSSFHLLENKKS